MMHELVCAQGVRSNDGDVQPGRGDTRIGHVNQLYMTESVLGYPKTVYAVLTIGLDSQTKVTSV